MRTKSKPIKQNPPADLEEVKRRFTRQNRDLAKTNATQALQIQSLKHEVDRLRDQNTALKEALIRAQREVQAGRRTARLVRRKMVEALGLVSSEAQQEKEGEDDDDDAWLAASAAQSPTQRQFLERQRLAELLQETQMPTILEQEIFPPPNEAGDRDRATEELWRGGAAAQRLSDQSDASADLGPPPVSRLECEAAAPFSREEEEKEEEECAGTADARLSEVEEEEVMEQASIDNEALLASVETRRKKKDDKARSELRRSSILALSSPVKMEREQDRNSTTNIVRTGAKRKLADRDLERSIEPPRQDEFTFIRLSPIKNMPVQAAAAASSNENGSCFSQHASSEGSPARRPRRALGDKPVNTSSPRKNMLAAGKTTEKERKPASKKLDVGRPAVSVTTSRSRRSSSVLQVPLPSSAHDLVSSEVQAPPAIVPTVNITLPPTTETSSQAEEQSAEEEMLSLCHESSSSGKSGSSGAFIGPDLFSPPPVLHDFPPIGRTDTPPPGELSHPSITSTGSDATNAARPSRRSRPAVNYAEPSLVHKMRRPGKQMVDAISGLQDPRAVMTTGGERRSIVPESSSSSTPASSIKVKPEPVGDDDDEDDSNITVTSNRAVSEMGSPMMARKASSTSIRLAEQDVLHDDDHHQTARGKPFLSSSSSTTAPTPSSTDRSPLQQHAVANNVHTLPAPSVPPTARAHGRRRRDSTQPQPTATSTVVAVVAPRQEQEEEELDIYDFPDSAGSSAPPTTSTARGAPVAQRSMAATASSSSATTLSRRHSSVPKEVQDVAPLLPARGGAKGSSLSSAAGGSTSGSSGAGSSRRRSMMV